MRIANVPRGLQCPSHQYPPHVQGIGLEEYFGRYMQNCASSIDTDWIYLPIYWTNNYVRGEFAALSRVQQAIDTLDDKERYFTLVQCDDGIYEQLPDNILVFGAGGNGHIPIPLLGASPHPPCNSSRSVLASFLGRVECGGPIDVGEKCKASSWDVDGFGARTRRAMFASFENSAGCFLHDGNLGVDEFRKHLRHSYFALAPRGYGRTSFRLYEAMELGCIPVYIHNDEPWLPYEDVIDWAEFAIVSSTNDIGSLPERLEETTRTWKRQATRRAEQLYDAYFTLSGMAKQIVRMIRERS